MVKCKLLLKQRKDAAIDIMTLPKRFLKPDDFDFPKYFTNEDGKKIRYGSAKPQGESRGTVVLTTGYADFTETYFETIQDFLDRGFTVHMMDWQGQGGSERYYDNPRIPSPEGPRNNIRDLHQFLHEVVKPDKDKPIFLTSHSMGGQMALHYLNEHPGDFDGAMLATPFVDIQKLPPVKGFLSRVFMEAACKLGMGHKRMSRKNIVRRIKKEREVLKTDEPVRMRLHQYFADLNPQLKLGDPSFLWIRNMTRRADALRDEKVLKAIDTPVLMAICEKDRLVNNDAIRRAAGLLPKGALIEIKDGYHGLWTERQKIRDQWFARIDSFIEAVEKQRKPAAKNDNNPAPPAAKQARRKGNFPKK